jgi:hypothetical protein
VDCFCISHPVFDEREHCIGRDSGSALAAGAEIGSNAYMVKEKLDSIRANPQRAVRGTTVVRVRGVNPERYVTRITEADEFVGRVPA